MEEKDPTTITAFYSLTKLSNFLWFLYCSVEVRLVVEGKEECEIMYVWSWRGNKEQM